MIDLAEVARRSPSPCSTGSSAGGRASSPRPPRPTRRSPCSSTRWVSAEHQAIYALHRDTKNCHLHLAVNRVHPDTEKLVTVNNGFDHEVAHRAIARIERARAGSRRPGAVRVARQDGELERSRPRGRRRAAAVRSGPGLRGAGRGAQRPADRARGRGAHHPRGPELARDARGARREGDAVREEGLGRGACGSGTKPVKASSAGRECSMAALQKRLGEFEPAPEGSPPSMRRFAVEQVSPLLQFTTDAGGALRDRQPRQVQAARRQGHDGRTYTQRQQSAAELFHGSWRGMGSPWCPWEHARRTPSAGEAALRERRQTQRGQGQREGGRGTS